MNRVNGEHLFEDMASTLKERLEEAAKHKGVTKKQARADLQRLTGMTRSNTSHWWGGRTKALSMSAGLIAAEYFGVDPRWLAHGEGRARPSKKAGARTMSLPAGVATDELASVVAMFTEMDEDTREAWMKTGAALLELVGHPSRVNPYGKAKRRPQAKTKKKPAPRPRSVRQQH